MIQRTNPSNYLDVISIQTHVLSSQINYPHGLTINLLHSNILYARTYQKLIIPKTEGSVK
jgi:hypothetical protein